LFVDRGRLKETFGILVYFLTSEFTGLLPSISNQSNAAKKVKVTAKARIFIVTI
jgi:hypothetical protein